MFNGGTQSKAAVLHNKLQSSENRPSWTKLWTFEVYKMYLAIITFNNLYCKSTTCWQSRSFLKSNRNLTWKVLWVFIQACMKKWLPESNSLQLSLVILHVQAAAILWHYSFENFHANTFCSSTLLNQHSPIQGSSWLNSLGNYIWTVHCTWTHTHTHSNQLKF